MLVGVVGVDVGGCSQPSCWSVWKLGVGLKRECSSQANITFINSVTQCSSVNLARLLQRETLFRFVSYHTVKSVWCYSIKSCGNYFKELQYKQAWSQSKHVVFLFPCEQSKWKNPHTHICGVKEFVWLSVCLSVTNFDLN